MTVELSALRSAATLDTSQYVQAANAAADAAKKMGKAADDMGEQVQQSDVKIKGGVKTLDALKRQIDPAFAASERLRKGVEQLDRAFGDNKGSAEHTRLLGLLQQRYDASTQAAQRAAKAQDEATRATRAGALAAGALRGGVDEMGARLGVSTAALAGLSGAALAAAASLAAAGVAAAALVAASIPAASSFQGLEASLRTVGGSAKLAAAEFEMLKQFALDTPISVEAATQAYIKLKALGLDPSTAALKSYGNTAGAMSKSLMDMIEAVADASTFEFERLKEFGIRSAQEGDRVKFTFQGVTTTVGKNSAEIQRYLQNIGNTQFASGLDEQSKRLTGALDNLSDNWTIFLANIGNSGPIQAATALINGLANAINGLNAMLFPSIDQQIASTRAQVQSLKDELAEMNRNPEAYGPEIQSRAPLLAEQEKILAGLEAEKAARDKLIATTKEQKKQETEESDEAKKAREAAEKAAAKEAARREEVLDKLSQEWDNRTRVADATKAGADAVDRLNVDLAGEQALREVLGVTTNAQAREIMNSNKALAEQANRARGLARDNAELTIETRKVAEAQREAADRAKELAQAQTKYAEEIAETAQEISADVAEDLYDSMTDPDRAASVLDFMKSLFKRIAVEAVAANVILPITTQVVGSMPSMFGIQAPQGGASGGPSGSINSPGFSNAASSMWSSVTGSGFGSQTAMGVGGSTGISGSVNAFGASAFGMAPGTVAAAPSAAFVGPMPMTAGSSSMLGGSTMMGSLAGGFAGAAAGGMVGSMIGNATQSKAIGAGSGALTGAAVGFMVGGPVGAAVGAIGGALMAALGTEGKPSNKEGNATYSMETGRTKIGGQTGDKFSQENRDAASRAAQAFGGIGDLLGGFADRKLTNTIRVVMGDRDGMQATMGNAKFTWPKRNDDAMRDMTRWFVDQFAAQLGQDLPQDVRTALQRVDWSDVTTALEDIGFAGTFRDQLKALKGDFGLVDEATQSTRAEVEALTDGIVKFKTQTARLGLDTAAAADATRSYVEGLLGMRTVAAPMNEAQAAVALLRVRFTEMAPLLREVGIEAGEAEKGLQRAIAALRDDFVAGLDAEFNELSGRSWVNQLTQVFAVLDDRLASAAALGGGSEQALRNNHQAVVNILTELENPQLQEAAQRFGGGVAEIANSILAARDSGAVEAGEQISEAVFDVAGFLNTLARASRDLTGRGYLNQIADQFDAMNEQLADAAKAGQGAGSVLANNHLSMVKLLTALSDEQLGDAAATFGGGIAAIAQGLMEARAALAQANLVAERAGFVSGLDREANTLANAEYVNAVNDQFAIMNTRLAEAARLGVDHNQVLANNHVAMVRILSDLTDQQLLDAAARFGGAIADISRGLIAGRAAAAAQEAAQRAAEEAARQAEAAAQRAVQEAEARVSAARQDVEQAFAREISAQEDLAAAARTARDRMVQFAESFKEFSDSLLTGDLGNGSPESRYNAARSQFEDIARRAAAGDPDAMEQLTGAASTFLSSSRDYNASGSQYSQDLARVQKALADARASATKQASAAEQAVKLAEQQVSLLNRQLEATLGVKDGVKSVADAVRELKAALANLDRAQAAVGGGGSAPPATGGGSSGAVSSNPGFAVVNPSGTTTYGGITMTGTPQEIAKAYVTYLGRTATLSEISFWENQTKASSLATTIANIQNSQEAKNKAASGKVLGGMVEGGQWNQDSVMVPLAGGEFVTRAPSVSASTLGTLQHINATGRTPANDETVGELRLLREQVSALVKISAGAGDGNLQGLASLDKRLATLERKGRLAGAA